MKRLKRPLHLVTAIEEIRVQLAKKEEHVGPTAIHQSR